MKNLSTIQLPASLDGISTKKDGSLGVRITTQELNSEQKVHLMEYLNQFGWFCFKPNEFKESELPSKDAEGNKRKTPAQRLRSILFLLWDRSDKSMTADQYYEREIERIIEHFKKQLD